MADTVKVEEKPPPYTPYPTYPQNASFNPNNPNYVPPPPPPGFQSYPPQVAPGPVPNYGSLPGGPRNTTVFITQPGTENIIIVGGCPACRVGMLEDDFTCLGIFCAIFFFPLGILCCLALRDKRCSNCGAYFG